MRALILSRPHCLEEIEVQEPAAPEAGQVLVAVRAVGVCGTDMSGYLGKMPFIQCPRILGHELGVEILAVGPGVTTVKPGDRCSVEPYLNCGKCHSCQKGRTNCCETLEVLGVHRDGGLCERLLLPALKVHISKTLQWEQLALVETLGIGCHAVERSQLTANEDVLIIGAGPIGLSVLEFARLITPQIQVIEPNDQRRAFIERHYPGIKTAAKAEPTASAQVVFDATGHPSAMAASLKLARYTGRVVYVGITSLPIELDDPWFHRRELTLIASRNALSTDFPKIIQLIEDGKIDTRPWVTHETDFRAVPSRMAEWVRPESGVVKALIRP